MRTVGVTSRTNQRQDGAAVNPRRNQPRGQPEVHHRGPIMVNEFVHSDVGQPRRHLVRARLTLAARHGGNDVGVGHRDGESSRSPSRRFRSFEVIGVQRRRPPSRRIRIPGRCVGIGVRVGWVGLLALVVQAVI